MFVKSNSNSMQKIGHFIVWAANIILSHGICDRCPSQVASLGGHALKKFNRFALKFD